MTTRKADKHAARPLRAAIERALDARGGPPPAWSVIVTLLGDAVLPRGGRIWTGSLLQMMALLGYGGGVVRTALSRLVADGWLLSSRSGRHSFYELTPHGQAETLAASRRIYRLAAPGWDGEWAIAILTEPDAARRAEARSKLTARGFAAVSSETMVRIADQPAREAVLDGAAIFSARCLAQGDARGLAARAWSLDLVAEGYRNLERSLAPILDATLGHEQDADALAARILLVHELRRAVLRDPDLPADLLPADWIGGQVRRRSGECYRRLLAPSERWLSAHASGGDGPLPAADDQLARRFGREQDNVLRNLS